jgi:hypothetical protein
MDNDGLKDIITNKGGKITIIYGGKIGDGYSYISKQHDYCDPNRKIRQKDTVKVLETFAVQLSESETVDDSLIRRK